MSARPIAGICCWHPEPSGSLTPLLPERRKEREYPLAVRRDVAFTP